MIAIMGAMHEEVHGLVAQMQNVSEEKAGQRTYYKGVLFGQEAVVAFSRWGKVAAATTATHLINHYKPSLLLFTGVAGAIHHELNIGDVVVGRKLYQHDMDARPLMKKFEIPLLGKTFFETDAMLREKAFEAVTHLQTKEKLISEIDKEELKQYNIDTPKVYVGNIASGDKFFNTTPQKEELLEALPNVYCVEMEGAAVAQVCYEYGIPFNIIRIISDVADDNAHIDFPAFIRNIASHYSVAIVKEILKNYLR
jgi:adenosylhomocysteine nucleosidase